MRILQVAPFAFPAPWGTPVYVQGLTEALVRGGHEVWVVAPAGGCDVVSTAFHLVRPGGDLVGTSPRSKLSAPVWQRRYWRDELRIRTQVSRLLRDQRWDLVYAHHTDAPWLASSASGRTPMIYGHHASFSEELRSWFPRLGRGADVLGAGLDRLAVRASDGCVALSRRAETELSELGAQQVLYNPPGVDRSLLVGGIASRAQARWGLGDREWVGYFGNLDPYQDIGRLLEMMLRMPGVGLLVVSPGDVALLHRAAAGMGIPADQYRFIGGTGLVELGDALASVRLAIVPRLRCSGVPMKVLNQLAVGVPTVASATACDPFPGVYRMESDSISDWVAAVRHLLAAPSERRWMAVSGCSYASKELSWEAHISRFLNFCARWTDPAGEW